jgi:hypothetical protein
LDVSETSSAGRRPRRRKQSGLRSSRPPQFAYNGDEVRPGKTIAGDTTEYIVDLAATLPVVISDTEAVYLYGLDILAQQEILRQGSGQAPRLYYVHDGLGSVRQLLDSTGEIQTNYAYDPFGVPLGQPEDTPGG